jgi:signal peptidase I
VTSGQYGGREYHAYPDHDGQSGWVAGSPPAAGRNGATGRNGHYRDYQQGSGYSQPDYAGAAYPTEDYRHPAYSGRGYQEPAYQEPAYQEPRYAEPGYADPAYPPRRRVEDDYPTATYRAVSPPLAGPAEPGVARHRPAPTVAGDRSGDRSTGRRKRRGLPLWQELPLLLIIAFCLAILVRTFLLQAFYIPSGSMEDTLIAGDRVLVNKVVYQFREPARGEVVVFRGTDAWAPVETDQGDVGTFATIGRTLGDLVGVSRPGEKDFIKRVIGLPGDTISCCSVDGQVFVNGQPLDENYVIRDSPLDEAGGDANDCRSRQFDEVVVEPGHMFVMGDHRLVSQDSRCQGQVPIDNIIGRAFVIVWPNGRWGSLSQPDTFAGMPSASAAGQLVPATAPPGPPAQLAFVLPILLPFAWTARRRNRPEFWWSQSARSRLIGRDSGRRLAE